MIYSKRLQCAVETGSDLVRTAMMAPAMSMGLAATWLDGIAYRIIPKSLWPKSLWNDGNEGQGKDGGTAPGARWTSR